MDKTEQNIKMCNTPEIQGLWKQEIGDYLHIYELTGILKGIDGTCLIISSGMYGYSYYILPSTLSQVVWLPRQDQLQEMVDCGFIHVLVDRFHSFVGSQTIKRDDSMEQLWLAFVMKEKYNKTWGGENWTSEENNVSIPNNKD